jgi:circadian clock protein KaiB
MPPKKTTSRRRKIINNVVKFEELLKAGSVVQRYELRLYITGTTPRSSEAIANIRQLCEEFLPGNYDLQVIDIYQQPKEAVNQQIIAAPTLVKERPNPPKRMVGNLSNRDKVMAGLNLCEKSPAQDV